MKHHIIYIPGLGDNYNSFRRRTLSFWRLYGVTTEYIPMNWYQGGSYEEREQAISHAVSTAKSAGKTVSLVSESAGGAIALNVYARDHDIYRLVSLCAVNNPRTPISPTIYAKSPAFKASIESLKSTLPTISEEKRRSITVLTSLYDGTVRPADSMINGVESKKLFTIGHIVAIATTLIFYGFYVTRFITRR